MDKQKKCPFYLPPPQPVLHMGLPSQLFTGDFCKAGGTKKQGHTG